MFLLSFLGLRWGFFANILEVRHICVSSMFESMVHAGRRGRVWLRNKT